MKNSQNIINNNLKNASEIHLKNDLKIQEDKRWKNILEEMPVGMLILSYNLQDVIFINKKLIELFEKSQNFENEEEMYDFKNIKLLFPFVKKIFNTETPQKETNYQKKHRKKRSFTQILSQNINEQNLENILLEIKENKKFVHGNYYTKFSGFNNKFKLDLENSNSIVEKTYTLELHICPLEFENEKSFVILFEDITKLEKLHNLKKNDEFKNRLLSSFSHELRTPLNGANSPLELCMRDPKTPTFIIDKYLINIYVSLQLLENFLNDIVDYSQLLTKTFQINIEEINIDSFMQEIIFLIKTQADFKKIEIVVNSEIEPNSVIRNDPKRFKQVMLNILSNSLKFTISGKIEIGIQYLDNVNNNFRNQFFKITIKDSGIGMKDSQILELSKLLNSFNFGNETISINSTGNGLGLSITQQILKKLNKKSKISGLFFKSEFQKGTEFWFILENFNRDFTGGFSYENSIYSSESEKKFSSFSKSISKGSLIFSNNKNNDIRKKTITIHNTESIDFYKAKSPEFIEVEKRKKNDNNEVLITFEKNSSNELNEIVNDLSSSFYKNSSDFQIKELEILEENNSDKNSSVFPTLENSFEETQKIYLFKGNNKNFKQFSKQEVLALIADDDGFNLMSLGMILDNLRIHSDKVFNGQDALDAIIDNPKKYSFILMDYQMPVMNGVEATKCIKEFLNDNSYLDIPIFACTAFSSKNDMELCLDAGMLECLTKPISVEKMKNVLKKYNILT